MKFSVFVLSLYCLYVFQTVEAHVKLLHPESRVDDTGLTSGAQPCGQVKPANTKNTIIPSGKPVEIKWEVAIPHRGGFLLELLDENEKVIQQLWNGLGPDNKKNSVSINLPSNTTCHKCSIRIIQKAEGYGFDYISCGDVTVLPYSFDLSQPFRP